MGRRRPGDAHVKHHIKAIDRLLGNRHLHAERDDIYRALALSLLQNSKRPILLVDWADFELDRKWLMLKAAVPMGGRALTIYEKVFPFKRYNSPGAHREFLQTLRRILPAHCAPILVTDAGFRGPWFREVEALGWDWVGRIRNTIKYFNEATGRWRLVPSLYKQATPKVQHLGEVTLSRRKRYRARLYLVRAYKTRMGRPDRRARRKQPNANLYRRLHKAPWLLATSLPHGRLMGRKVKQLYATRMQIEQTFRDTQCHRWGLSLRYAGSRNGKRLEILLLIGALAMFLLWLLGVYGRRHDLARHLQANTERKRAVLSVVFIGAQLLQRLESLPTVFELSELIPDLHSLMEEASPL